MKNTIKVSAVVLFAAISMQAFTAMQSTFITGKIVPADAVEAVWAIKDTDSLSVKPTDGIFKMEVKPGTYKILIDAKEPIKDLMYEKLEITEGKTFDLGEVKLVK